MLRLVLWLLMLANSVFFIWLALSGHHGIAIISLICAIINIYVLEATKK